MGVCRDPWPFNNTPISKHRMIPHSCTIYYVAFENYHDLNNHIINNHSVDI